jgi:hypothetical protein
MARRQTTGSATWLTATLFALGCGGESSDANVDLQSMGHANAGLPESDGSAAAERHRPAACQKHADCESLVCDTYAEAGRGKCISRGRVLYVSAQCASPSGGAGTSEDPFCQIGDAVRAADALSKDVIRVMPGLYLPFSVSGQRLRIFGPAGENGVARVFEEDAGALRASGNADVVVDGFALGGPTHSALRCESARAVVRRSTLQSDVGSAVQATDCELHLDRAEIRTQLSAAVLANTRFAITNTFITGASERIAIIVQGGEGSFRFVTVAGNYHETSALGPFDCGSAPILIQDSIVMNNRSFGETGSQFQGACVLDRVVVGDDTTTSPGAIHEMPILVDGYRLPLEPANLECCIDRAPGRSIRTDIEGTRRPQGPRSDLGAYEARQ